MKKHLPALVRQIAQAGDISERYAYYLVKRERRASPDLADRLAQRTGVPAEAWLFPDRHPNPFLDPQRVSIREPE